MANAIRELVSKKKNRYKKDEFNLDLTYINERIIAMGFPSENVESIYRNPLDEVRNFLEKKHKDHYKIYNLCSERSYDIQKFHSRVSVYPFDDHNPPEFGQMRPFCEDVSRWLEEDPENVAVVHCKAGKGRTGLMICAYLLHCKFKCSGHDVLEYYAMKRTADIKGVTIPSQRRYVDYYASMISENLQYNPVKMYLTSIVIDPLPQLQLGQTEGYIQFEVRQTSVRPFVSEVYQVRRTDGRINIDLPSPLLIVGDIKIEFSQKLKLMDVFQKPKYLNSPNSKLFHFWVNTFFIDQQRSSVLTHSSPSSASSAGREVRAPTQTLSWQPEDRNCRSTHNSGGTLGPDSPMPPPRALRPTLSSGDSRTSDPASQGSSEDQSDDHSPNGSCLSSAQTIHCHPPAKTVSIVEHYTQVGNSESSENDISGCESIKQMSISADEIAETATHTSFIEKRQRHSSVPQTARPQLQAPGLHTRSKRNIPPGRLMSVRLNKNQIDKAAKDKSGKFNDNFNVTLFLVRPNDQTLQAEFSRSNMICQRGAACDSSEDSSEEEPAELRRKNSSHSDLSYPGYQEPVARTLSAHLPPLTVTSEITQSQSTWI